MSGKHVQNTTVLEHPGDLVRPMDMRASLFVLLLIATSAITTHVSAQGDALQRVNSAEHCLSPLVQRLTTTMQLLRETRQQLNSSNAAARSDAAQAVRSLEQRIAGLGQAIRACVPQNAGLETQERVVQPTGADARVAERNAATTVIERDVVLVRNVKVIVAERVDGSGNAPAELVRRAIRGVAGEFNQCYTRYLENGALQPGQAIVAFTVTGSGAVQQVRVEGVTLEDRRFSRCLSRAASHIRMSGGTSGGHARYAYTLHFGPTH